MLRADLLTLTSTDSSVSQHPSNIASTAAYLLFYRRRSEQPLGPPELQQLVNKSRNPDTSLSVDASDADDSAGEGERLGDRSSASYRLPGSSSAGTLAAGVSNGIRLLGAAGGDADGRGNAANRVARLRGTSEDGDGDEGYSSGHQFNHNAGWSFGGLDQDESGDAIDAANTPADTASDRPDVGSDYGEEMIGQRFADTLDDAGGDYYDDGMFGDVADPPLYNDDNDAQERRFHLQDHDHGDEARDLPVEEVELDELGQD